MICDFKPRYQDSKRISLEFAYYLILSYHLLRVQNLIENSLQYDLPNLLLELYQYFVPVPNVIKLELLILSYVQQFL